MGDPYYYQGNYPPYQYLPNYAGLSETQQWSGQWGQWGAAYPAIVAPCPVPVNFSVPPPPPPYNYNYARYAGITEPPPPPPHQPPMNDYRQELESYKKSKAESFAKQTRHRSRSKSRSMSPTRPKKYR